MKPHIEQTITDLKTTVEKLNGMIAFLADFGAGIDDAVIVAPLKVQVRVAPKLAKPSAPRAKPVSGDKVMEVIAKLPEPFNAPTLIKQSGISLKTAQGVLYRLKKQGKLINTDYGFYKRSASFGANGPSNGNGVAHAPSKPELEKKLESALRQRDAAREAGRDSIVEMFQKEIDQLEEQLA